ncbi:hypothetical protein [Streptomyces oceani]|uniref:hypothetical protein n=1 Tax=Streptomyces oceani TaxID=1075402 RepID=UPI00147A6BC7|nr:hypothetical protein [Streptomyces oceani]
MMNTVLLLLTAAIVLGVIGWLAEGLFWLFLVGVLVLVIDLVLIGVFLGRGRGLRGRS